MSLPSCLQSFLIIFRGGYPQVDSFLLLLQACRTCRSRRKTKIITQSSHQQLICMIIGKTKHLLLSIGRISQRVNTKIFCFPTVNNFNRFSFSSENWNQKEIIVKIDEEIQQLVKQCQNKDEASLKYFKKGNWDVDYDSKNNIFSYSKTDEGTEVKVLTYTQNIPENSNGEYAFKNNFTHLGVFIRNKQYERWMKTQLIILQNRSLQILSIIFSQKPELKLQRDIYKGPDPSDLPQTLISGIRDIFQSVGLTGDVLRNMSIYASRKIDEINMEWMKNLREIWA